MTFFLMFPILYFCASVLKCPCFSYPSLTCRLSSNTMLRNLGVGTYVDFSCYDNYLWCIFTFLNYLLLALDYYQFFSLSNNYQTINNNNTNDTRYRRSSRAKTSPTKRKTHKNSSLIIDLQLTNSKTWTLDQKLLQEQVKLYSFLVKSKQSTSTLNYCNFSFFFYFSLAIEDCIST